MEQRKYPRMRVEEEDARNEVWCEGIRTEVDLIDISAGGVRLKFFYPVSPGMIIKGRLEILHDIMDMIIPYFVVGEVIRVAKMEGGWETGVRFKDVRISSTSDGYRPYV
jgi:hypothetical protein